MISAHVLHAGDGYKYYTDTVAAGDKTLAQGENLVGYYAETGAPKGRWVGGGIGILGVSGEVTEAQMRALFGEGLHPNADAITARMVAEGASEKTIQDAIKLGARPYRYDLKPGTLAAAVEAARLDFMRENDRPPERDELRQIRMREGAIHFRDANGRQPVDSDELAKYVAAAMKPGQHAVTGIDLTYSPPKSVSKLWHLAKPELRARIEAAIERADERTIAKIERDHVASRAGKNGVEQIDVDGGLNITAFDHYDSRNGDPQRHTHYVVANRVFAEGKWRTLDSSLLLRGRVAYGKFHTRALMEELTAEVGVGWVPREVAKGKPPVWEIAGIPAAMIEADSTRNTDIRKQIDKLSRTYARTNGRQPDAAAHAKIAKEATLQTRPVKQHRSLGELFHDWHKRDIRRHGRALVRAIPRRVRIAGHEINAAKTLPIDLDAAAAEVMLAVEEKRGVWSIEHVEAAAEDFLINRPSLKLHLADGTLISSDEAVLTLAKRAIALDAVGLTPDHIHGTFAPLTRANGQSLYVSARKELYTSMRVLTAENELLSFARAEHLTGAITPEQFAATLAANPNSDHAQVNLAREFVTNPRQLLVGVGPAGAGKTRSIGLAATALHDAGKRMIGLAPSAAAAAVFARDVGVDAHTAHLFLQAHTSAASPADVPEQFRIRPGDVVVVDEGAMATTPLLRDAAQIVIDAGGYLRPLGDHKQISGSGPGDAFKLILEEVGGVELEKVYRFTDKAEASASLILRDPAPGVDPFAWYKNHGRIIAGSEEVITDLIFTDYLADLERGRETVMAAPTHEMISELNRRAQAHAIAAGAVKGRRTTRLSDGARGYIGDPVVARQNKYRLTMNDGRDFVRNGDLYRIDDVHRDGSITVTNSKHHGTIRLPADYVAEHIELGYAPTIIRTQGDTVGGKNADNVFIEGSSRLVADATTALSTVYVGLTRGTSLNTLYLVTEPGQHMDDVLAQIAGNIDNDLSAHETIARESARMTDLPRLVAEHQHVVARATGVRFEGVALRVLGDTAGRQLIGSAGWPAAAGMLARTEKHGLDPAKMLAEAYAERKLGSADDTGAVLSWRIGDILEKKEEEGQLIPLPALGADTGTYEWAIDRATQNHPDVPQQWRLHLAERAAYIDHRMTLRGAELAAEQPEWIRGLGPVPERADRQKRWMRLAAETELFRGLYNIPVTETATIPQRHRDGEIGQNLAARVTALHKSTAISHARGNTGTLNPDTHLARILTLQEKADAARPRSEAERIVHTLDPERASRQQAARVAQLRENLLAIADGRELPDPIDTVVANSFPGAHRSIEPVEAATAAVDEQAAATLRAETDYQPNITTDLDRTDNHMTDQNLDGYDNDSLEHDTEHAQIDNDADEYDYDVVDEQAARSHRAQEQQNEYELERGYEL